MRSRNRARGSQLAPLWSRVLRLFDGGSVFTASRYTVDGVSGKVARLYDWLDSTHYCENTSAVTQLALPAAESTVANALVMQAVAATTGAYVSSRAASSFRYFHDGTGCTVIQIYRPESTSLQWPFSTAGGVSPGLEFGNNASHLLRSRNAHSATGAAIVTSTWYAQRHTFINNSVTPESTFYVNGSLVASTDTTPTSAGDPVQTLKLFQTCQGNFKWLAFLAAPRVLAASQIALVNQWAAGFGLAAV